jgi:small subunit ribosomal protein S17
MAEKSNDAPATPRGGRKTLVGKVVSDKMEKTAVVAVENLVRHPLYGKIVRRTNRFKAHNENNDAREGDTVEITETRPLSREKRWRISRVIERAK